MTLRESFQPRANAYCDTYAVEPGDDEQMAMSTATRTTLHASHDIGTRPLIAFARA
jgi:hypothetical protein